MPFAILSQLVIRQIFPSHIYGYALHRSLGTISGLNLLFFLSLLIDEVCIEVLTNQQGYQCRVPNIQTSLAVKFASVSRGQLDDLIQVFLDRILQVSKQD